MAKVTITITDLEDERGNFSIATEFDPPLPRGEFDDVADKLTNAQKMGLYAISEVTDVVESQGGKATFRGPTN